MHSEMNIKDTFLALTSKTYPYGFEQDLVSFLPSGYQEDEHGNYFLKIGNSRTIFASHLDTACKYQSKITHQFKGNHIKTDGTTILGADDKAGVTILLYMIENGVSGTYYFFIGEEVGCVGSGLAAKNIEFFSEYDRIISFDRRGTTSVITHQSSRRCCSDSFADQLSKEFNKSGLFLSKDSGGVYTDSAEFTCIIPECTNISVGYYKEHTHDESQDIDYLESLCKASIKVDWESLVVKRDPSKTEWLSYNYNNFGNKRKDPVYDTYGRNKKEYNYPDSRENVYIPPKNYKPKRYYDGVSQNKSKKLKFDKFEEEIETDFSIKNDNGNYEILKRAVFDDKLTKDEFETVKDQYLNMDDPEDRKFAKYIESVI